jgi:hypothetical protein
MSPPPASADPRANRSPKAESDVRWYALLAGVINVVLLLEVVHRFHHASAPINHGMARVLATALIVNATGAGAIVLLTSTRRWLYALSPVLTADLLISLLPFLMAALRDGEKGRVFHLFALTYVIFLLCRLVELLYFAARNAGSSTVRLPVIVFAATFIVYGGLAPWMALASSPQGDEAHFMILTHSLATDHDFDVGDNYANGDYKEQYPPSPPGEMRGYPYASMERDNLVYLPHEPHVVRNFRGQLMLEHDMGFPLLLVPGYALDKREGALFTQALIGAAGAAAIYEAATLLGADIGRALLTIGLFCFTCPYWVFTQSALSDLAGAVGSLWIGLQFLRYRVRPRNGYLLLAGILIAFLPWLNIRFWALAGPACLLLCAWILRQARGSWSSAIPRLAWLGAPSLIGLAAAGLIDKHLFDTYLPNASMLILQKSFPQFGANPVHALLGMLFDQSFGLLPTAPLYVAVFAGMIVLWRRDRWAFAAFLLPALGYLPFVVSSKFWSGGWCAPGRYMLSIVTLMIPAAALVLNRKVVWIVALLTAWSLMIAIMFTVNPYLRMPSIWVFYQMSMLVEFFHDHIHTPIYSILSVYPNMMLARVQDWLRGWFWLLAFSVGAWAWSRTAESVSTGASASRAILKPLASTSAPRRTSGNPG